MTPKGKQWEIKDSHMFHQDMETLQVAQPIILYIYHSVDTEAKRYIPFPKLSEI